MANSNGTHRTKRTPTPLPQHRGDGAPPADPMPGDYGHPESVPDQAPRRTPLTEGTRPRPVTAETAYRCRLWEEGTLILEDPFGSYEVTAILDGATALVEEFNPEVEPRTVDLRPERTLTFVPSQ